MPHYLLEATKVNNQPIQLITKESHLKKHQHPSAHKIMLLIFILLLVGCAEINLEDVKGLEVGSNCSITVNYFQNKTEYKLNDNCQVRILEKNQS